MELIGNGCQMQFLENSLELIKIPKIMELQPKRACFYQGVMKHYHYFDDYTMFQISKDELLLFYTKSIHWFTISQKKVYFEWQWSENGILEMNLRQENENQLLLFTVYLPEKIWFSLANLCELILCY